MTVNVTYDGSSTAPTDVGSYAVVAIISDINYQGSANGTLVIEAAGKTWVSWQGVHFNAAEQTAGLAAENADPDADGLVNLSEYALGANPRSFTPPSVPVRGTNSLSLTFTRPADLSDVNYAAEFSQCSGRSLDTRAARSAQSRC